MRTQQYHIYTDASFSRIENLGVAGFLIFDGKTSEPAIRTYTYKETNNIRAEIVGAIWALQTFIEDCKKENQNADELEINLYSDCQTITNLLTRRKKLEATDFISARKKSRLANADLYKTFFLIYDELQPKIHWVKGHSKKESQTLIQKNFALVDKQVRKKLRAILTKGSRDEI